jgi:DNA end-binding protein Ku
MDRKPAPGIGDGAGVVVPAISGGARISFHQLHEPSGKRIRYQKIVSGIAPVDTDDIVKGFDQGEGQYVLLEDDEIDSLKIEAKRTLDLAAIRFPGRDRSDLVRAATLRGARRRVG